MEQVDGARIWGHVASEWGSLDIVNVGCCLFQYSRAILVKTIYFCEPLQDCINCGILVFGIRARGVSSEHMEDMEMFSCSPRATLSHKLTFVDV